MSRKENVPNKDISSYSNVPINKLSVYIPLLPNK
jgi:hypothetical protein